MAIELHWYDLLCFSIVIASIIASVWMIHKEGGDKDREKQRKQSNYESLLLANTESTSGGEMIGSGVGYVASSYLWRSPWSGVHPAWLILFRLAAAAALAGVLLWDLWTYDPSIFVYYTEWTFLLVIIYFLLGALISAHGCWVYSKQNKRRIQQANNILRINIYDEQISSHSPLISQINKSEEVNVSPRENYERKLAEKRAGTLGYSMQIIYQTCGGAVMLTDVVFWCLLAPFISSAHFSLNMIMGCMHSLNLVFLLIDTFLNSMPFPWFRLSYFILWSCTYVIFQWILHFCGFSWWPYPFLELSSPWAPLWYFCMALIHIPCYGIYWLIVRAKNTYFPKCFPNCYVRSD